MQNVEHVSTELVDIAMVDLSLKFDTWRFEWIVGREFDIHIEHSVHVGTAHRAKHLGLPHKLQQTTKVIFFLFFKSNDNSIHIHIQLDDDEKMMCICPYFVA